jgi:hypothetical protein
VNGGIDLTASATREGMSFSMTAPMAPGMPPMALGVTAETLNGTYDVKGVQSGPILNLAAWFVAHPSGDAIIASQDELRALLQSGLPYFEVLEATGDYTNISVTSPVGTFTADSLEVEVDVNGAVADGRLREAIEISGLSVPAGIAPPWAEPLIPTDLRFDFEISNFNLADPLMAMITAFDLSKPQPFDPGYEFQLIGAFLPTGAMDVTFLPTAVSNDMYSVTLEGALSAGMGGMPIGQGVVTAKGLDEVQAALQSAPADVRGEVLGPLGMAMGLSQPGPDGSVVWEIDATKPGTLKINGMDMMGMQ